MSNAVIQIQQTRQNGKIAFICTQGKQLLYRGESSFLSQHLPAYLMDAAGQVLMQYEASIRGAIKAALFSPEFSDRTGALLDGAGQAAGWFYQQNKGMNRYYTLSFHERELQLYMWGAGGVLHILIYDDTHQIAQIEKEGQTLENLDSYTLYLLEEELTLKPALCFAAILYDQFEYGHQKEVLAGAKAEVRLEWSLDGIGKRMYHPDFMVTNFPGVRIRDIPLNAQSVKKELSRQWRESVNHVFTRENYKRVMFAPSTLIFLAVMAVLVLFPAWMLFPSDFAKMVTVVLFAALASGYILFWLIFRWR